MASRNPGQPASERSGPSGRRRSDLLRASHLFAAAVREVLEDGPIHEVSHEPLAPSQMRVLKVLSLNSPHPMGVIAAFLRVTPPSMSKCIDKLERLGLLTRQSVSCDWRTTVLKVSSEGRDLVRKYDRLKAAFTFMTSSTSSGEDESCRYTANRHLTG